MASLAREFAPSAEEPVDTPKGLRVGRNALALMAGQVVYSLLNVAAMALLGNALGPHGYGDYAFYYALIPLFASASDVGIGIIVTREVARDRSVAPRLMGDALLAKAAVSGLLLAVVLSVAWTLLDPGRAALVSLVAATGLIDPGQDPSIWMFRARERLHLEALLLVISQLVWLPLLGLAVLTRAGLPEFLGAATLAFAVRLTLGAIILVRRFGRPEFHPQWARLRRLLADGLPFGIAMFGTVLYGRIGLLMLKMLATPADVGYFNVALMLSQPLNFVANVIGIAILPIVARDSHGAREDLRRDLVLNFKWQALTALPLSVGLFLLSRPVVAILFRGRTFEPAAAGLQLLSLGLTVMFLNLAFRYLLAALNRQRYYLRAILWGIVVNLALCVFLVPRFGFLGACSAMLGAEVTISTICLVALSGHVGVREQAAAAVRPLLAALGMGLLVAALPGWNLVALAGLGGIAYVALLFLLGTFSEQETQTFRHLGASFGFQGAALLRRAVRRP